MNKMVESYLGTALWSSTDDHDEPLDDRFSISDFPKEAVARATADCAKFQELAGKILEEGKVPEPVDLSDRVGHDFWLTRNGHGAGFWDGDYPPKARGEALTEIAHSFGEQNVVIGDDGELYLEGGKIWK